MEKFISHTGAAAPMDRSNVDTDSIIPKQFLKRVERTGYGPFLFFDWRYTPDGGENPEFVLNKSGYREATILVAGPNFGSGSSREHAPWALAAVRIPGGHLIDLRGHLLQQLFRERPSASAVA